MAAASEDDLLAGARLHVRGALVRKLTNGRGTTMIATSTMTPGQRLLDDYLLSSGLHVTRSVLWPELSRVSQLHKPHSKPPSDPLEAAATLYHASRESRDSCVQTDHGTHGMDPVAALGESRQWCNDPESVLWDELLHLGAATAIHNPLREKFHTHTMLQI